MTTHESLMFFIPFKSINSLTHSLGLCSVKVSFILEVTAFYFCAVYFDYLREYRAKGFQEGIGFIFFIFGGKI